MRNIQGRLQSKIDWIVQEWLADRFTYREEKRSANQLRDAICDVIQARDNEDKWVMKRHREELDKLKRPALIAMLCAASHSAYSLTGNVGRMYAEDRGPVALYFETLHSSDLTDFSYGTATYNLSRISPKNDVYLLHHKSPEAANALLRLIIHFMIHGKGVGLMSPAVKSSIFATPEIADDLIEFSAQRRFTCLNDLDFDQFQESLTTPSQALRDGLL